MKTLVLGDTHGRSLWKEIVNKHDDFNRLIFIGDYFDTHEDTTGLEQLNNFLDICKFKRKSDNKEIILLIGNHDHHYLPGITDQCSGYQHHMRPSFESALESNKDLLQMCYMDEEQRVYTHAGVSKEWLAYNNITSELEESINDLFKYKPNSFSYFMGDQSGYGDHIRQSPIWIRPNSLYRSGIDNIQIIGHTSQPKINLLKSERQGYYLIDTLGTSREYLIIEDGLISKDDI